MRTVYNTSVMVVGKDLITVYKGRLLKHIDDYILGELLVTSILDNLSSHRSENLSSSLECASAQVEGFLRLISDHILCAAHSFNSNGLSSMK